MKKFSSSINGYNKDEVHNFVNEITAEYEKMLNNLKNKDTEIATLKDKCEYYAGMEKTLNRAISVAEDASNQIKSVAKEEARGIVDDAHRNASRIINNALINAEKINTEADTLRRRIILYKKRIRQVMEEQLEMVDDVDKIDF